jgi:hypothetical protein
MFDKTQTNGTAYIENNTWVLGNTRFISRVEHDISLVRAFSVYYINKIQ